MNTLIAVVGASGVGKTALVQALSKASEFSVAYEQHSERPFQMLFKQDTHYALANQIDYLLLRAEQEREVRGASKIALVDGGLDLDFHGFTRLFHARGWLNDSEYDLCRRFYKLTRQLLPLPDLIIHLTASGEVIASRLTSRERINIATAEDTEMFNSFLEDWLETLPRSQILRLDVSKETKKYSRSIPAILAKLEK